MRINRFFIKEDLRVGELFSTTDPDLVHQLRDVFRVRGGEQIIVLNNTGQEFLATLTRVSKEKIEAEIISVKENVLPHNLPYEVHLYMSMIKKDNFEWVLQKGTELGVTQFVPLAAARSEKKNINTERALKIMKEASEQSGRGFLPTLDEVIDVKEAFRNVDISFVAFHLDGEPFSLSHFKTTHSSKNKIGILIGPEGGWTSEEIALFKAHHIPVMKLGEQVLRAETAALAVSALFLL